MSKNRCGHLFFNQSSLLTTPLARRDFRTYTFIKLEKGKLCKVAAISNLWER